MAEQPMVWSKPYYCVTHLTSNLPFKCQITMVLHEKGKAEAYMLNLNSDAHPHGAFSALRSCYGDTSKVRKMAESWTKLGAITDYQPMEYL